MAQFSATILVTTQDAETLELLHNLLTPEGLVVVPCQSESDLVARLRESHAALVIADVQPPGADAAAFCESVRAITDAGIIILSTIDDASYAASLFQAGADDYIRKPFGDNEFIQRVHAMLRRTGMRPAMTPRATIQVGPLLIDRDEHVVMARGMEMSLSPTEFTLLVYFAERQNHFLTSNQILDAVWGADYADSPHLVATVISRLRQKLNTAPGAPVIEAVRGVGYRFTV